METRNCVNAEVIEKAMACVLVESESSDFHSRLASVCGSQEDSSAYWSKSVEKLRAFGLDEVSRGFGANAVTKSPDSYEAAFESKYARGERARSNTPRAAVRRVVEVPVLKHSPKTSRQASWADWSAIQSHLNSRIFLDIARTRSGEIASNK
mmetsp:Transcript_10672/g.28511  ORF Transcript_10672/g.28511 Transcript_10672/m.28511 type:complete len:152 (-) Transcript_10672:381-836(-)